MPDSGFLSHAIASAAFVALAVPTFVVNRNTLQGRILVAAVLACALWSGVLAAVQYGYATPYWAVVVVEVARYVAWLVFLYLLAPQKNLHALRWTIPLVLVVWAAFGGLFVGPARTLTIEGLTAALLGMVLVEQVVRNAPVASRRDMRFLMFGIGGMFAYDLFLFSQAELLRGIDGAFWRHRGLVNLLLVPFLVIGTLRFPRISTSLFAPRHMAFYTTTFVIIGLYILTTAAAGLLARRVGGQWGEYVRLSFLIGAAVVLVLLVGSVTIRREIRVLLSKHVYRSKYDYRLEWLRFIRTLSGLSASDVPAASVQSVAQILNSPGGVLYRKPEGTSQYVPVGSWPNKIDGLTQFHAFAADSSLVAFMQSRRWIIDLREYEQQPDLYDHAELPVWLSDDARWRLVSPIFLGDSLLGFFLLLEPPPAFRLMYEDRDLLNTAGQHVATLLALQDADQRVAELSQLEAYNRLTTFVMHDLKNCAAQLQLLVDNASRHRQNPQFVDDAFTTIAQTAERVTRLIRQLRRKNAEDDVRSVDLRDAVRAAIARCASRRPSPVLDFMPDQACTVSADPEQLTAAIEHVICNAQEAAGEVGDVRVVLEVNGDHARIWIRDSGAGMDSVFIRSRLFRPFDTTKGPTGMGIGAYQAREIARSMGGEVEVRSDPGQGTSFAFKLPIASH